MAAPSNPQKSAFALRWARLSLGVLASGTILACGDPSPPAPPVDGTTADAGVVDVVDGADGADGDGTPIDAPSEASGSDIMDAAEVGDVCLGETCPPECGAQETLESDTGACVCQEGTCQDPWTDDCLPQYLDEDFASVSIEKDVLAAIRVDLLERYLDVELMREHVYERLAYTESTAGSFLWQKFGFLLISDHLCSLYQLGVTEPDPYHSQAILDAVEPGDPKMYMPLVLSSIVSGRVDQCVLHGVIDSLVLELNTLLLEEPSPQRDLALKGALTRYLVTIDFYGIAFDGTLVGTVSEILYPTWTVQNYGVWDSALVYDLVNAYYLVLTVNEPELLSSLDAWWQDLGGVELADCVVDICPIKGIHQVVFIDAMLGIIPEDKLVQIASLLVSNVQEDGSYGFPAVLGLDPDVLWLPSYCDIFCSSKHWHITFALNHLLARLEHREADIKAGAALLEL